MRVPGQNVAVSVGVGVGVGAVLAGWWAWRYLAAPSMPHTWEEVGEVSELVIYPLKSARGIPQENALATRYGLSTNVLEDRSFMIIDDKGNFITGRQVATLATIVTQWHGQTLTLKAEGFEDASVDIEDLKNQPILDANLGGLMLKGVDCGDKVAQWLTIVLYKGENNVRLIYKGDVVKTRTPEKPDNFDFKHYRKTDRVLYADNSTYMLSCQSSLDDLNNRLSEPVSMKNFRPNIVVQGSKAYDEDDWIYVKIGQVILRRLKPCDRCVFVSVDPVKGKRHKHLEPLTTLRKYRLGTDPPGLAKVWATKPIFGISMSIDLTGPIAVGDKVSIARASVHPHLKGF